MTAPAAVEESTSRAALVSPRVWWRHAVWLVTSIAAGGAALFFIYAERWSIEFTHAAMARSPYLPALIVGVGIVIICRLRDRVFPGSEGTGIPQAMAALQMGDTPERRGLLSLRIAVGKLLLLALGLFAGATLGREGPTVHVAACVLYFGRALAQFPAPLIERGLILAGGAAGIAAAFNAPIAGIVFAFEEIGRSFDKRSAGTVVRTVAVACLVCIVPLSDYLFYGEVRTPPLVRIGEWAVVPLIGLAGGLLGGLFARAVAITAPRVGRLARRAPYQVAGSLGLMLAVLGLLSGGATYGGGDEQAHAILIHGQTLPGTYPLFKALGSFVTLISSIPGGLFTPSLSVGAGLGQLAAAVLPGMNRQTVVMLGMAAYFSGVVQSPITAAVIMFEMTGDRFMLLPLLVATVLAYEASHLVCPVSLYESLAGAFLRARARPLEPPPEGAAPPAPTPR
jgi:H+/Cl- antiporter ClcA